MKGEWGTRFRALSYHTDAVLAIAVVGLLLLLIIPLPPLLLDALLCVSIVLSVMVLLLTLYIENALEFSAFPSVLLFLTLYRLGLNIGSTRMILSKAEAGDIIQTFGDFIIQGNEFVGLILFLLLTIINFVVVTKGAGRIAEVAARFTLEALPGKQMAIDSELSSGLITHSQAKDERKKISQETDFYGAMDGASKFVKGDAVAGLIMTIVNLAGGMIMGVVIKGLSFQQSWKIFSRLTIGDGLVSQIPALLVSISAAMMVSRTASGSIGKAVSKQILYQPKVTMIAAVTLLIISFVPGMPKHLMIPLCGILFIIGILQLKSRNATKEEETEKNEPTFLRSPLEIHLGYQAVIYAEALQNKLKEMREKFAIRLGIRIPAVQISDQVDLTPAGWEILVKGVKKASGLETDVQIVVNQFLKVVECHCHELINRQDVAQMLQAVKSYDGAVVEELYPKKLTLGQILKVLQNLLKERVPIRDFASILEILADYATGEKSDLETLTEKVRQGLAGKISEEFFGTTRHAHVITLDPKIEEMLNAAKGNLRPKTINQLAQKLLQLNEKGKKEGIRLVVVTTVTARPQLRRLIEKQIPELPVLSFNEVVSDIELSYFGEVSKEVLI